MFLTILFSESCFTYWDLSVSNMRSYGSGNGLMVPDELNHGKKNMQYDLIVLMMITL